jgi:hypothetical protein
MFWENCCFISLIPCKYYEDSLYEGTTLVPDIIREHVILVHDNERIDRLNLLYEGQGQIAHKCQGSSQPDCPRYAQHPPGFFVCYTSSSYPLLLPVVPFLSCVPPFSQLPLSHDSNRAPTFRSFAIMHTLVSHY